MQDYTFLGSVPTSISPLDDHPNIQAMFTTLMSASSGPTEPSSTQPFMIWADTTNNLLKQRDSGDANWITIGTLDTVAWGLPTFDGNNTFTGTLALAPPSGDAFFLLQSEDGQSTLDMLSKTGTVNQRRTRFRQSGNIGGFTAQDDAGVNQHDIVTWNQQGAVAVGSPTGGLAGTAGSLNLSELRVNNEHIRDYSDSSVYAFSGNAITMQGVLGPPADFRTNLFEITVPNLQADTNGFTLDIRYMNGAGLLTANYVWSNVVGDQSAVTSDGQSDSAIRITYPGGFRAGVPHTLYMRLTSDTNFRRLLAWMTCVDATGAKRLSLFTTAYLADGTATDGLQITVAGGLFTRGTASVKRTWT